MCMSEVYKVALTIYAIVDFSAMSIFGFILYAFKRLFGSFHLQFPLDSVQSVFRVVPQCILDIYIVALTIYTMDHFLCPYQ